MSPCAWGGVLNPQTTSQIKEGTIVCGAANAQLLDPADDCGMTDRGVIYVPDFCANPMGIVNCANEAYGRVSDPLSKLYMCIYHFYHLIYCGWHAPIFRLVLLEQQRIL